MELTMKLQEMIKKERNILDEKHRKSLEAEQKIFEARCDELRPMLKEINEGLVGTELKAFLHTNKKHYPCPAIHFEGRTRGLIYDYFSEIFLSKDEANNKIWKSGGCNRHNYIHKTDNDLKLFMASIIADKVLKRIA